MWQKTANTKKEKLGKVNSFITLSSVLWVTDAEQVSREEGMTCSFQVSDSGSNETRDSQLSSILKSKAASAILLV